MSEGRLIFLPSMLSCEHKAKQQELTHLLEKWKDGKNGDGNNSVDSLN